MLGKRKFGGGPKSAKRPRSSYRKRRVFRKGRGKLVRMIRNVSIRNAETKYAVAAATNSQLYHNGGENPTYVNVTNMLATSQGTSQTTRVGDCVFGRFLSIKLWLSNKLDRPNVMYRIMVVSMPADQYAAGAPTGYFRGESANKIIDSLNTDRYKIVASKLIQPFGGDYSLESGATNREHSRYIKMAIPLKNRQIYYTTDGGNLPVAQRNILSLSIIAFDAHGSLLTDNIASFSYIAKFYFKDP